MINLYISDTYVVLSKNRQKKENMALRKEFERGIIVNGIIVDIKRFSEILKELFEDWGKHISKINLIIDSNAIIFKSFTLPQSLNKENIEKYVSLELKKAEDKDKEYVHKYFSLDIDNSHLVICESIEKGYIEIYRNIFESFNISIRVIQSANSIFITSQILNNDLSGFIAILNKDILSSFIVSGTNIFLSRSRIPYEINSDDFLVSLRENLHRLHKFYNSPGNMILFGFDKNQASQISEFNPSKYENVNYGILSMEVPKKQRLNFAEKESQFFKNHKLKFRDFILIMVILSIALVTGGIYDKNLIQKELLEKEILINNAYINDVEIERYSRLTQDITIYEENNRNMEDIRNFLFNNYENITGEIVDKILQIPLAYNDIQPPNDEPTKESILNLKYSRLTNSIIIEINSKDISLGITYTASLKDLDIFEDVVYQSKYYDVEDTYNFVIECFLRNRGGDIYENDK